MGERGAGPARTGAKWTPDEENHLLRQLGGDKTAEEIAFYHERGVGAIRARVVQLIRGDRTFEDHEEAFEWARAELRKGLSGQLDWAIARADQATGLPKNWPRRGWRGPAADARRTANPRRRTEVLALWSCITGRASGQLQDSAEVDVLAHHEDGPLRTAGTNLFGAYGRLDLADWVLECDWPDVESLNVTVEQIRSGADIVRWCGAELLRAGLRKVPELDRDIVFRRLGLDGEPPATLVEIGLVYGLTPERIRQRRNRALDCALVNKSAKVFRCWDHVSGVLSSALRIGGDLDTSLVLAFVELVTPQAPQRDVVRLIAKLCGKRGREWEPLADDVAELARKQQTEREEELRAEKKRGLLNKKVQVLIDKAEWPPEPTAVSRFSVQPCREAGDTEGRGNSGRWKSAKLGRPVGYDSHAELDIIQRVEFADLVESYCEQPLAIPYRWNDRERIYYPDLMVDLRNGRRVVIEVKGSIDEFALHQNVVKSDAARRFCHERGWGYLVACGSRTFADLASRPVNHDVERHVRKHLAAGSSDWRSFRPLMSRYNLCHTDLASMVLRNDWYWYMRPWRLSLIPLWQEQLW